ncbi:uncharacterized protein E0L32_004337 [Thyridium curvatum]|uniref:Uncharacterized protein n=1 Tax=Thyridium curvatum TaxID=1093900 RepID=A0A507BED9_9PEZI|nr:uncharacterized protein E0L32_004337 [Thyridium curvatum]TPX15639.1 hypothetical protein E0L32_004337 [Thyridium curvatum]
MSPYGILDNAHHQEPWAAARRTSKRPQSGPPGPPTRQGRRSLSELDQDAVRRGIAAYMAANARPSSEYTTNGTSTSSRTAANQRLQQRPQSDWVADQPAIYSDSPLPAVDYSQ